MAPEWNIVATTQPREFLRAKQLLQRFGEVATTDYYNVLVMEVPDAMAFLEELTERAEADPRLRQCIARVGPMTSTFDFGDPSHFEAKAREVALAFAPKLEGKSFHVRITRRGFKHELSSQTEEQFLDHVLLEALEERGAPGRITFDDPDAILELEIVDGRAGMALWTREDLQKHPLLKVD